MRKKFYLLFLFFVSQSHILISQESVVISGGDLAGTSGTISYSIGIPVFTVAEGSTGSLSQGVQQPYDFFVVGTDNHAWIQLSMSVYPNPVSSSLHVFIDGESLPSDLQYRLFDSLGKLIDFSKLIDFTTEINMTNLKHGVYFLTVSDQRSIQKSFQIIKH